jgi:hypothetical protein
MNAPLRSAPLSVSDIARGILPDQGILVMLRAFFDDSGTHEGGWALGTVKGRRGGWYLWH